MADNHDDQFLQPPFGAPLLQEQPAHFYNGQVI